MNRLFRNLFTATLALMASTAAHAEDITVFAAASLTNAMTKAAENYEVKTGNHVRLSFASSSTLARQIAAGAPADLYISANQKWMDWLANQDLIAPETRQDILANSLVLIAPADSALGQLTIDDRTGFLDLISPEDRIAVGDPEHVPAGIYAKQALTHLGQWDAVEDRLARADNVRAALALVERGEAPLGIVYRTDAAIAQDVKIIATFPEGSHPPITYPIAMIKDTKSAGTTDLQTWLMGNEAGVIFAEFGFGSPKAESN